MSVELHFDAADEDGGPAYLCEDDYDGANERLECCSHVWQVSSGVHVFGNKSSRPDPQSGQLMQRAILG